MTIIEAIQTLEEAADVTPATESIQGQSRSEIEQYYNWLKKQAPMTALMFPHFSKLTDE
mgnify:CR=1 FL=1